MTSAPLDFGIYRPGTACLIKVFGSGHPGQPVQPV
jgi:hypothetical protein